ncbi:hypothetical protein BGZ83_011542 [Gryganskiella cystojenkinii]|nr:hypothetical protein BGZ83_011542 [Gryganskiella cystojenkinii]
MRVTLCPLHIPELLHLVLEFLGPLDLIRCAGVSRLWHHTAAFLLWQDCHLGTSQTNALFLNCGQLPDQPQIESESPSLEQTPYALNGSLEGKTSMGLFQQHIPRIRYLTLGDSRDIRTNNITLSGEIENGGGPRIFPDMTKLVRLQLTLWRRSTQETRKHQDHYQLLGGLINQNPCLRDISFSDYSDLRTQDQHWVDHLLEHIRTDCLKKLSIKGFLCGRDMQSIFQFFGADVREESRRSSPTNPVQLQELVLQAFDPGSLHGAHLTGAFFPNVLPYGFPVCKPFAATRGSCLAIISLTLIGFRTEWVTALDGPNPHDNTLLRILVLCPNLQKLVVSPDSANLQRLSPRLYKDRLYSVFQERDEAMIAAIEQRELEGAFSEATQQMLAMEDEYMKSINETFASLFPEVIPKLQSLEYGGQRDIESSVWETLTEKLGERSSSSPLLDSVSVWGARYFSSTALWHLINHTRDLTSLDISGCPLASDYAWAPLWILSHLKHYRALGVPILAERLVDWGRNTRLFVEPAEGRHWACKRLESLAVWIAVPVDCDKTEYKFDTRADCWRARRKARATAKKFVKETFKACKQALKRFNRKGAIADAKIKNLERELGQGGLDVERRVRLEARQVKLVAQRRSLLQEVRWADRARLAIGNSPRRMYIEESRNRAWGAWKRNRYDENVPTHFYDDHPYPESTSVSSSLLSSSSSFLQSRKSFEDQVQEMVCEQLGRLTSLKDLTLEGPARFLYDHTLYFPNSDIANDDLYEGDPYLHYEYPTTYTCMELTLKTGLQELAPLGTCLQRVNVHALEEKISRDRETVRWIAHHWGGYRAKSWEQGDADGTEDWQLLHPESILLDDQTERRATVQIKDEPRALSALLGVRCQNTVDQLKNEKGSEIKASVRYGNLGWLKDRCPWIEVQSVDELEIQLQQQEGADTNF